MMNQLNGVINAIQLARIISHISGLNISQHYFTPIVPDTGVFRIRKHIREYPPVNEPVLIIHLDRAGCQQSVSSLPSYYIFTCIPVNFYFT